MSFDARSLERLQQLGRTLPQPLPRPAPRPEAAGDRGGAQPAAAQPRHKVETETDPEALFRELMQASPDGTVPPHLLDRLRSLECQQRPGRPEVSTGAAGAAAGASAASAPAASTSARPSGQAGRRRADNRGLGRPDPRLAAEHSELYTAFQQLLLDDEEP